MNAPQVKPSFFVELQRRNVLRAAAFYAASAWLLVQVATQVFPFFHVDEAIVRWIVIAALTGFPFAMLFSWFYEWTPQGVLRESEVDREASITGATGKKLDKAIIAVLALAVLVLLLNQFVMHRFMPDTAADAAGARDKSIAVLPFVNMSGDAANEYFSDGITEEILNAAAQLPGLHVAARTSAFQFKGQNIDLRKVGETLAVAYLLEGSVQRSGESVRITAQLIDARNGYHLWSGKFDRKLTSVFSIEDEIAAAIVDQLKLQLGDKPAGPLVRTGTRNPQAHELYLKGLAQMADRGPALLTAAQMLEQAVAIDPDYAAAWGALAQSRELLPWYDLGEWTDSLGRARSAAEKALSLDASTASAHSALATVFKDLGDYTRSGQEFRRAMTLDPNSAEIIDQHAQYLLLTGYFDEAIAEQRRAVALDPLSGDSQMQLGTALVSKRRYAEALDHLSKAAEAEPINDMPHLQLAFLQLYTGHFAEAEQEARKSAARGGESADTRGVLVKAVADPAQRPAALRLLHDSGVGLPAVRTPYRAVWFCLLGDCPTALAELEAWAAVATRRDAIFGSFYLGAPAFDPIRADPRFKAVFDKACLPMPPTANPAAT
ncbi:MAG: hypothetical protein JWQ90_1974 [Hydrocarboniphaga sp.]|uniref:tetratricopeptide repeat protein n=1 Tax=Hydrocarboniphaga sp. TaxID=2033016 RepID=UPI00262377CD|nr:hypothetical protein [Hydrocarboniphaga sp.]MDB5969524.1 hypothetical protein [Hydrocarboniphaga sp.]